MVRISFIITYYNEPLQLLEECVQSVLGLPLPPAEREILLIDDGSKVPAPEFDGVTVLRQENGGLSAARNKGLELAHGEYIQFLDADDFLLTDAYQQVLSLLSQHQPDMLLFGITHTISWKNNLKGVLYFRSGIDFMRSRNMRSSACGYLFRRSLLGELRFYPGILHEDELFTPQLLLKAGNLVVADIPSYYYRLREDTITHHKDEAHVQKRLNDTLFVIRQLDDMVNGLQDEAQEALRRRVSQLVMDYIYIMWQQIPDRGVRHHRIALLREAGLYPLPLRTYTCKYWLFALVSHFLKVKG